MLKEIRRAAKMVACVSPLKLKAKKIINKELRKTDKNAILVVCPGGIGDTVISLILAEQQHVKYRKEIVYLAKRNHSDLFRIWGKEDSVRFVVPKNMRIIDLAGRTIFQKKVHSGTRFIVGKLPIYDETKSSKEEIFYSEISRKVYGIELPSNGLYSVREWKSVRNRKILLVPYTISIKYEDNSLFEKLSKRLSGLGYDIYTNTTSKDVIAGTKPFNERLCRLIECIDEFDYIIANRCGLNDLFEFVGARQVIIYPDEKKRYYYSTKPINQNTKTEELVWNGNSDSMCEIIMKIISM